MTSAPVSPAERFRMSGMVRSLLVAASGVGIWCWVLRVLSLKMKRWIQKSIVPHHPNETVAMKALSAVKAASSVATEVAKISQLMLAVQSEGKLHFSEIARALQAQSFKLTEAQRITRGIMEDTDRRKQALPTTDKHVKTRHSSEHVKTCHSTTTDSVVQAPSFLEVMAMLERGETPPGIKNINDKPPVPNQLPSLSCLPPKPKPWEQAQRAKSNHVPYAPQKIE